MHWLVPSIYLGSSACLCTAGLIYAWRGHTSQTPNLLVYALRSSRAAAFMSIGTLLWAIAVLSRNVGF